ncbi:MAG: hypothetical protein SGILL_005934 [Bacillariaceae sp.]
MIASERSRANAAAAEIMHSSSTRQRRRSSSGKNTSSPNASPTRNSNQRRSSRQGWRSNSSETFPQDNMPLTSPPTKGNCRRNLMVKSNSSPSLLRYQDNTANRDVPPPPRIRGESPRTQTVKKHALQNALHGLEEELYQLAAQEVVWPKPMTPSEIATSESKVVSKLSTQTEPSTKISESKPKVFSKLSTQTQPGTKILETESNASSRKRSPVPKPPMTGTATSRKQRSPVPKPHQKKSTPPSMRNNLAYPTRSVFDLSSSHHSDGKDERKSKSKKPSPKSKQRNSTAALTSDFQNRLTLRRHHSGNTVEQILGLASTISNESTNELTAMNAETDPNDHKLPFRTRSFDSPRGRKSRLSSSEMQDLQQDYLEKWYGGGSPPSSSNTKIPHKGKSIAAAAAAADPPPRSPMRKTSPLPPSDARKAPLPPPSVEDVEWD